MARVPIAEFGIIQKALAGANVTIYQADASGEKTTTLATLYQASTGSEARSNPQTLNQDGKLDNDCYVAVPVVAEISNITITAERQIRKIRVNPTQYPLSVTSAALNASETGDDVAAAQAAASTATTQAGIATTKAGEASADADLTAADAIATAADRVQTGLDVVAADASADAAAASAIDAAAAAASVGFTLSSNNEFTGNNTFAGKLALKDDGELTIAAGAVTITGAAHRVDTQGDAPNDDLDTINGGANGDVVTIRPEHTDRTVVLTNAGNIVTPDGLSITLDSTATAVVMQYDSTLTKWLVLSKPYANVAYTNLSNTFTKAQRASITVLTDGATVTPDFSLNNDFFLKIGGNRTLANPTNAAPGQSGSINIRQDSTGSRTLSYQWGYEFPGGTVPALTTTAGGRDTLYYDTKVAQSSTVTITIATPGVVSYTAHGLYTGQKIQITTTGALPTGLTASTTYYVIEVDENTFRLATSLANAVAGTAINTTGSQSGVHTLTALTINLSATKGWA